MRSTVDHSNFTGPQNDKFTPDHSNFTGPQGIPVPKIDLEAENAEELLRQDAQIKHKQAAETGNLVMEIQARVEQSVADRIRDHERANHQNPSHSQSQHQFQQSKESVYGVLSREAAFDRRVADLKDHDLLREEAQLQETVADLLEQERAGTCNATSAQNEHHPATSSSPHRSQQQQIHSQAQQRQPADPFSQATVSCGVFRSAYDLKLDAAVKQSIASRTHDQQLMNEAHLEQSIADSLSPSVGGQPLYGTGPRGKHRHHHHNARQESGSGTHSTQPSSSQPTEVPQQTQTSSQHTQRQAMKQEQSDELQKARDYRKSDELWDQITVELSEESSYSSGNKPVHDYVKYPRF